MIPEDLQSVDGHVTDVAHVDAIFLLNGTGFLCVALTVLKLAWWTRIASNSQRFTCLCLWNAGIKGVHLHAWLCNIINVTKMPTGKGCNEAGMRVDLVLAVQT